jgi:RimJ/RimL family protein N-acetyltransferase
MIGEKEYWNRGFGTDAIETLLGYLFDELGLNRVYLIADERNVGAIHCYEKLGLRKEGLLRQNRYKNGVYTNDVEMSLLRQDWQEKRSGS